MRKKVAIPDRVVAEIAARQHGVVSTAQLRAAGLGTGATARRIEAGRLRPVHRGVYGVGHRAVSKESLWMAAVLAVATADRKAFLSHRSAAALWGLLSGAAGPVEVVVPGHGGRARRAGILLHRSQTLTADQTRTRFGIPATTPARTVEDLHREPLRTRLPHAELRRVLRQAGVIGYELGRSAAWDGTRSELETRFIALCRRHRLPIPETNADLAGIEVDFVWRDRGLIVETDGYRFHRGPTAFEEDRRRDLRLRAQGFEVLRLTFRQVVEDSGFVARTLAARLGVDPATSFRIPKESRQPG